MTVNSGPQGSAPAVSVEYRLRFEKPIFLTPGEIAWRKIRLATGAVVTALTVVLVILVSAIFPARIANGGGVYPALRAPLAAGLPAAGDYVVLGDDQIGTRSGSRIFESLFREHSIVQIVAVPGDELTYQGDSIAVNGVATPGYKADITPGAKLSAKYLVLCMEGGCERGSLFTAPSPNVLGSVSYDAEKRSRDFAQAEVDAMKAEREAKASAGK